MPREVILGLTQTSMDHFIYVMAKSYYLNMSWGCNMAYHTFKLLLEEETRDKIVVTRSLTDPDLSKNYHPSQLEKRFGGGCETPLSFWPPYVGPEFQPENSKD